MSGALKLLIGLLYLRTTDDDSIGCDLVLRKFKSSYNARSKARSYRDVYVDDRHTDIGTVVRYSRNALILFVNSIEAFHGVSPRLPTPHNRIFINIVATVQEPLFSVPEPFGCKLRERIGSIEKRLTRQRHRIVTWLRSLR